MATSGSSSAVTPAAADRDERAEGRVLGGADQQLEPGASIGITSSAAVGKRPHKSVAAASTSVGSDVEPDAADIGLVGHARVFDLQADREADRLRRPR